MLALVKNFSSKLSNYPRLRILLIVVAVILLLIILMNLLSPRGNTGGPPSEVQAVSVAPGEKSKPVPNQQAVAQYQQLATTSNQQQFQQTVQSGGSVFQNPFDNGNGATQAGNNQQTGSGQSAAANQAPGNVNSAINQATNSNAPVSPQQFASQQQAEQQAAQQAEAAAKTANESATALQTQLNQLQQQLATQQQVVQNNQVSQLENNMRNALSQIAGAWKFPNATTVQADQGSNTGTGGSLPNATTGPVIIKAGTIYFAVLATALDSDQPGTPVMATIVNGPYQGAKLMGGFQRENDALVVQFNLMSLASMPNTIGVNAYAIDANTANNAIATSVDNHYLLRYGMLFAASFLQGFGNAYVNYNYTCPPNAANCTIINSNGTPNTATTATTAAYQGLGQIGTNLGSAAMNVFNNTPPTVTVAQGTGIGILFMTDVTLTPSGTLTATTSAPGTAPTSASTTPNTTTSTTTPQSQP